MRYLLYQTRPCVGCSLCTGRQIIDRMVNYGSDCLLIDYRDTVLAMFGIAPRSCFLHVRFINANVREVMTRNLTAIESLRLAPSAVYHGGCCV